MDNIITAAFGASRTVRTRALHQWDYGQILRFDGIDLPSAYTVHFSNTSPNGTAKTQIGNADGVTIPDEYLTTGQPVYAWVYLHTGASDGETVYTAIIPVTARSKPVEDEPTPVQQGVIDQAIAALNEAVEQTADDVEAAGESAAIAQAAQEAAEAAQNAAESAQAAVEGSAESAVSAANSAAQSANNANTYAEEAAESAAAAASSAQDAGQSESNVQTYAGNAAGSANAAAKSAEDAEGFASAASGSADDAAQSASDATRCASAASQSAGAAAGSATAASGSASAAAQSATEAAGAASAASTAKVAAETAQGKAEDAQEAAEDAQSGAEAAAQSVQGSAAQIAQNAGDIVELKSDITATEDAILSGSLEFPVVWENGTINSGTSEAGSSTRKRTGFLSFGESEKIIITVPENKRIYGWYYSSPSMDDFINSVAGGWHTESFELVNDVGKYYRFTISDYPEESTMVDASGFTFVCDLTYFAVLDDKIVKNEEFIRLQGRNLFNPADCANNFSLGIDGKASSNSNYWITGYINVSDVETLLIPVDQKLRYCWYSSPDENGFIDYGTKYNPVSVIENANYIRVCYSKTVVPFDDRWKLYFIEYNANPAFDTYQGLNYKNIEPQDNQFFRISGNYTETFSIDVNRGNLGIKNQIVSFKGNYTGDAAPTIRFSMPYNHNTNLYTSQLYTIDEENMAWRIPAFPDNATRLRVTITIPTGTTLAIKHLFNAFDNVIMPFTDGYKLYAHLGVQCIYPQNTMLSFNAAASLGYPYCVTVPKRTSDGIWVCFHDDSNVGNTLKMPDGSNMPSADASKSISYFTYAQLMMYDAGIKKSPFYAGEKVPTLESFFSLCQKTGMHPVLSVHPIPTSEQYDEIKFLSDKYNLTKRMVLKFGSSIDIQTAFDKLGDEVESYMLVVSTDRDGVQQMLDLGLTVNHATLGIEWTDDQITSAKVQKAKENNMLPGCFIQYGTSAQYKELLDMGVYEITDDNNCSFGLNW